MYRLFLQNLLFRCLCILLLCQPVSAQAREEVFIVDGKDVVLTLTPRTDSNTETFSAGEHFDGRVAGVEESWVRLSRIDDQWQGLISIAGELHLIEATALSNQTTLPNQNRVAKALDSLPLPFTCGASHADGAIDMAVTLQRALSTTQTSFDTLCSKAIDDTCAVVELELVFDKAFVAAYPRNYQAQAASLLNLIEGFYVNDFGIRFDTLSTTFLSSPLFTAENTSSTYLNDITSKKAGNQLDFVKNKRAILHVVRGQPFSDDVTAGIAWVGGLCSDVGYSVGTSVLFRNTSGSQPSIPITSLVTAHEIGHNLGAEHDNSAGVLCPSGYIMDAFVNTEATRFSSCSKTAVKELLGDLSDWQACTDYPVKLTLTPDSSNVISLPSPTSLTHRIAVNYETGYSSTTPAQVTLTLEGVMAEQVAFGGTACEPGSDGSRFVCSSSRAGNTEIALALIPVWTKATITAQASFGTNNGVYKSDVYNIADDKGTLSYQITTSGPASPSQLTATLNNSQASLNWQDNSSEETGFRIERRYNEGEWLTNDSVNADITVYTDALAASGKYEYRVLATTSGIASTPSNIASLDTDTSAPDATLNALGAKDSGGGGGGALIPGWIGLMALVLGLRRTLSGLTIHPA